MPHLETPLGRVAYETVGDGPPLLLLHATLHDRHDFDAVLPALARSHRVIAIDWPGHGDSPAPAAPVTASGLAVTLEHLVVEADARGIRLIGNSVGGYAAARLAMRHPDRVAGLVLVDKGGFTPQNAATRFYCRRVMGTPALARRLLPAFTRAYMRAQSELDAAIVARVVARAATDDGVRLAAGLWRSFADPAHDLRADADHLTVPMLIAWGRHDRALPLRAGRATAAALPRARFATFDTGHVVFASQPRAFLDVVEPFLAGLPNSDHHWPVALPR